MSALKATSTASRSLNDGSVVRAYFHVTGPADPSLLPRLVEPFAKLGHVPDRVHASREAGDGSVVSVDLRLAGVPQRTADLIERALRGVIGVHQVIAVVEPQIRSLGSQVTIDEGRVSSV